MQNRILGMGLVVVGVLIVAAVLLAAPLRLAGAAFGIRRIIGLILGLFVLVAGLVLSFSKGRNQKPS